MYWPRQIETALQEALATFPVVVLTGARQCGKTTLIRQALASTHRYVSLDELDLREAARADPRGFLRDMDAGGLIDEIQHVPDLLPYIKAVVDRDARPGRFVLTGSQHFPLMRGVSESLAGRAAILRLAPFSVAERQHRAAEVRAPLCEWLDALADAPATYDPSILGEPRDVRVVLGDWLLEGGFPPIVAEPRRPAHLWFPSYVQTYLDRDIRLSLREQNLAAFERLLRLIAARSASTLNQSSLARDVGVSVPTIDGWISLLEASGVVERVPAYSANLGKRETRAPKLYMSDTGLAAWLTGLRTSAHLLQGPMAGALFETAIVSDLLKRIRSTLDPATLYHWRTRIGEEVDIIVESADRIIPIEVKLSATITSKHVKSLRVFLDAAGPTAGPGLVICNTEEPRRIDERITAVPWWML